MNKRLDEEAMQSELSGSQFFNRQPPAPSTRETAEPPSQPRPVGPTGPGAQQPKGPTVQEQQALSGIRTAVKQLARYEGTFRFTFDEQKAMTDLIYEFGTVGIRTNKNELVRIALNWLILNHNQAGNLSVFTKVLEELND